jgi:hypothetical protein
VNPETLGLSVKILLCGVIVFSAWALTKFLLAYLKAYIQLCIDQDTARKQLEATIEKTRERLNK